MSDYHLEKLGEENSELWDALNTISPDGSLYHSLKWKKIAEQRSGVPLQYYLLLKNEEVVGLFPLQEHTIYGFRGLVPAGDPLTLHAVLRDYHDPFVMWQVIEEFRSVHRDWSKISFVCLASLRSELFQSTTSYPVFPYPFSHFEGEGEMVLDLVKTPPDAIWNSFSNRKGQRKYIRRFETDGFGITDVRSEDELRLFYTYYEENMCRIGGNHLSFSYFLELLRSMPDQVRITLLSKGPLVAGGAFNLLDPVRRRVHGVFLSQNRDLPTKYSPSYYLYWDSIRWAWENGYRQYTLGREYAHEMVESNPRYRLKRDFGAEFEPVHSRLVPMTTIFSIGARVKYLQAQRLTPRDAGRASM